MNKVKPPTRVNITGRYSKEKGLSGSDVKVFDAETGWLFSEAQSVMIESSIDGPIKARITYFDEDLSDPNYDDLKEASCVSDVVLIDIQPLKKVS